MKNGQPQHPIHSLLSTRWSPYAFSPRTVSDHDLQSLFTAASWAASSFNEQPWRYIVERQSGGPAFQAVLECLSPPNQDWARYAPVLAIGLFKTAFTRNGKLNRVALHDLGQAAANMATEATARGLVIHQMAGVDLDRVRTLYAVPADFEPATAIAIGYPASPGDPSHASLSGRDAGTRTRRPLAEFVFAGKFGDAASF
ncbi:MAG: nitroreductase family protein [Bryobacteraceae bacterium]